MVGVVIGEEHPVIRKIKIITDESNRKCLCIIHSPLYKRNSIFKIFI